MRMFYGDPLQMIGLIFICRWYLHLVVDNVVRHSFADNLAGRCYGPSLLRGSILIRIASSLDLCPKVLWIDHNANRSCVLQVVLWKRIDNIKVLLQRIEKIKVLLQRIENIKVLLQRIENIKVLLQRIKKIKVLLQRIEKIKVLLQRIEKIKVLLERIKKIEVLL